MNVIEENYKSVSKILLLTDKIIENPQLSPHSVAPSLGVSVVGGAIGGICYSTLPFLLYKLYRWYINSQSIKREKERLLKEVLKKQQAIIAALSSKLDRNTQEINNLKEMLEILMQAEAGIRTDFAV
ncbi:MAG: hypothetical protein QMB84_11535 [Macellibacteroides fermentans]